MARSWAPLLAVFLWSGNFVVTKLSAGTIEPVTIGFYRCCVAVLVMTPFLLPGLRPLSKEIKACSAKLVALALFGTVIYQGMAYFAAAATTATNMGIITSLVPLATIGISSILGHEKPGLAVLLGAFVSLIGLFILVTQGNIRAIFSEGVNYGDALIFIASISYAFYCVLLSRWIVPLSLWQSLYMQSLWAVFLYLPMYLLVPSSKSVIEIQNIPLILYAGIIASVLAPLLWMQGVAHLGPSRTSTLMNLFPLITALMAIGVLKEKMHLYHLTGGVMTLVGVAIAQMKSIKLRKLYAKG